MKQHLSNKETDELGESYISTFYKKYPNNSLCVDIEGFATDYLGLKIEYETFAGDDTDTIGFLADGKTPVCIVCDGKPEQVVFPWKTVVIDKYLLRASESGRKRFTIAHETAHYLLEKLNPEFAVARHHREFDCERDYNGSQLKDLLDFAENRADRLAAALMMPKFNIDKAMERFAGNRKFTVYGQSIMLSEERVRMQTMADGIGVTFTALQIRLRNFGLIDYRPFDEFVAQDYQEGDFDDSDIDYNRALGRLDPEQIYLIHRSRRESEKAGQRTVRCPACGFRMATVTTNTSGSQQLRCRKCQLNEVLNFAYFRKQRKPAPPFETPACFTYKKKKR